MSRTLGKPGEAIAERHGRRIWLDRLVLKDATIFTITEATGAPVYDEMYFLETDFLATMRALGYRIEPPERVGGRDATTDRR